jgi:hypothetical protein
MQCLQIRASALETVPSHPPCQCNQQSRQILPSVSDVGYINCSNQTISFQFRTGLFRTAIYKQPVAYVTRTQSTNYENLLTHSGASATQWQAGSKVWCHWLKQTFVQAAKRLLAFFTLRLLSFLQSISGFKSPIVQCPSLPFSSRQSWELLYISILFNTSWRKQLCGCLTFSMYLSHLLFQST